MRWLPGAGAWIGGPLPRPAPRAGWLPAAAHSMQARRGVRGQAAGRNQQPAAPPAIAIGAMPLPLEAAITMMAGLAH